MGQPEPEFKPGDRIDSYTIVSEIGHGAVGVVYLAKHVGLNQKFALKILNEDLAFMPGFVELFQHEAQLAANLKHKNIVRVRDFGEFNGRYYYAMDYVDGDSLEKKRRQNHGRFSPKAALDLIADVAAGLAHAHSYGIVHRDLKPENIMIARDGTLKITDFGLAHVDKKYKGRRLEIIETPELEGGTEGYIAPEVANGNAATTRSDVYSLGALLHFLLVGETPPVPGTCSPEIYKIKNKALIYLLSRALNITAARRYLSAKEFLSDLEKIRFARERFFRAILFVGIAGIVLAVSVAALFFAFFVGEKTQRRRDKNQFTEIVESGFFDTENFLKNNKSRSVDVPATEPKTPAAIAPAAPISTAPATSDSAAREYWERSFSEKNHRRAITIHFSESDGNTVLETHRSVLYFLPESVPVGTYNVYFRTSSPDAGVFVPVRFGLGADQVARVINLTGDDGKLQFFATVNVAYPAKLIRIEIPEDTATPSKINFLEIEIRPTFSQEDFLKMLGDLGIELPK